GGEYPKRADPGNMRSRMRNEAKRLGGRAAVAVVLALAACGGAGPDEATKFAGPWTFESGELTPMCMMPFPTPPPFPLKGLTVTLTKVDNSTIRLEAGTAGCKVTFKVSGDKATSTSGQSCMLEVGTFGAQTIKVDAWTLMLSGDRIESTTAGFVLVCMVSGSGVLAPGAPDAG